MLEAEFQVNVNGGATINTRSLSEFLNICTVLKQCDVEFTHFVALVDPLVKAAESSNGHAANQPPDKPVAAEWGDANYGANFGL